MRKTFNYRLYPNHQPTRLLEQQLAECRWLYKHLLAARKTAWEQRQASVRRYDQQATLPALTAERTTLAGVQSPVLQNVAGRSDLAFHACFRRGTAGEEEPGSPRFRGKGRYDSLTFPQVPVGCRGCRLDAADKRVRIATIGRGKVIVHRPLQGPPTTASIQRSSTGKWDVSCACECAEPLPVPEMGQRVGMDGGLTTLATLSTGEAMAFPRCLRVEEQSLATVQRRLSKDEKGTPARATRRHAAHERGTGA